MGKAAFGMLMRAASAAQVRAAVAALEPGTDLRDAILRRYDELAANPRRDYTAEVRGELLDSLRPLVTVADIARLEAAITTYEYGAHGENAARLRAAALLCLGDIDPNLAEVYAVHLLADGFTDEMSGEPGVTAARFLHGRGQLLPLLQVSLEGGVPTRAGRYGQEVLAEALPALAAAPATIVLHVAQGMRASVDDVALVGLIDLFCAHPDPGAFAGWLREWALTTERFQALNYAAAQVVASRREPLQKALADAAATTTQPDRRRLLEMALGLA